MNKSSIPTISELRILLHRYENKNNKLALVLWICNYCLFFFGQYCLVILPVEFKLFGSLITIMAISRLFVLGHDACHNALTSSKRLNYWLAQIAFLPVMTSFQGWKKWHNMVHHSFNNLVQQDAWNTLSNNEYIALNNFEKLLYRFFRSAFGVCFYYFMNIWFYTFSPVLQKPSWFPPETNAPSADVRLFWIEFLLIILFIGCWIFSLFMLSNFTNQAFVILFIFGFVVPFVILQMTVGMIVYLHHTHPEARWYDNQKEWDESMAQLTSTVHIRFPDWISSLLHHIMEHPAHHINSRIPFYNLKAAQRKLEETYPDYVLVQNFSWRWYLECTRICKLYDFEKHEWVQFPK